ncbi:CXC domain-containing protein [Cephalotus follicularis]|uniref:CXC domain-containing protein n=1 Tax=Cephalotus follicularis TaxID=3775 RepID=A0A1Q3APM5_CEPFO|nr:CXC domain-containing protein [Cephalotus follicularis]
MDTPEKTQIANSLSKFEDSPVFNYINSLSPIKPVKSIHITQTFNSLSFASLPSVFTSPHVSSHKESRFIIRHNYSDQSKSDFSSVNGDKVSSNEGVAMDAGQLYDNSADIPEHFDPGVSIEESSVDLTSEQSRFTIELPQTLKYDSGSPDRDPTHYCGTEAESALELAGTSVSLVPVVQKASENGSCEGELHLQRICQTEQNKQAIGCDWEGLISDAAELLVFNSPNDSQAFKGLIDTPLDLEARLCTSLMSQFQQNDMMDIEKMHMAGPSRCGEQYGNEDQTPHFGETSELKEINQTQHSLGNEDLTKCINSDLSEEKNYDEGTRFSSASEPISNLHRGFRRRCLDFEMVGAQRRNTNDDSNCSSSMLLKSDEDIASKDNQVVPIKPGCNSSRCMLPGIGLHLNALAITSKDNKNVKHEKLSCGRPQRNLPSPTSSLHSPTTGHEPRHDSLTTASGERGTEPAENGIQLAEDGSQASIYLLSEECIQDSPKKKRRRLEQAGESESCKRCNCKKSKCLKLYCECFAAGVYCIEPCACQDCFNKPIHEDTVLATRKQIESRNPLAFAPKVMRSCDSVPEVAQDDSSQTPASARHKRGCNCKKSSCLKKYCECYQGGVGCSINCRCEGCKNAFGRKDGSAPTEIEAEVEEDETETCEKVTVDKAVHKTEVLNNEEQSRGSALPITPFQLCRSWVQLPFSSKCKPPPPRSLLSVGPSSVLYNGQKYGKPNIIRTQPKFEKHFQTVPEDEMPEILRGNCSPCNGMKTASPKSKRVSPPHSELGSSPGRRSGRKLILQSIPSFPSLTPQQ